MAATVEGWSGRSVDLAQWTATGEVYGSGMDKPSQSDRPESKLTRLEEACRIIEDYANDLREIIQRLRRKMN
jgi:hypothetical protein